MQYRTVLYSTVPYAVDQRCIMATNNGIQITAVQKTLLSNFIGIPRTVPEASPRYICTAWWIPPASHARPPNQQKYIINKKLKTIKFKKILFIACYQGTGPRKGDLYASVLRIRIWERFFPDPGSQTHTFESLVTIFWAKSAIILC